MSDDTTVVAPETDSAVPDLSLGAPGDGTAVDTESAELRKRFNGLMAKHQSALDALVQEREQRIQAEARLQEGQNTVSDQDNATLSEVQALRAELQESRLAAAREAALRQYPDAAPFADMIAGKNPTEVLAVTRAFAERAAALRIPTSDAIPAPEVITPVTPGTQAPPVVVPQSVSAPMAGGGSFTPSAPTSQAELLQESRRIAHGQPGSQPAWEAFWQATAGVEDSQGLA